MQHEKRTEDSTRAGMTVLNALRPGLDEKLDGRPMALELVKRGRKVDQQKRFPVKYDGVEIGVLIPDMFIEDLGIAEPKVFPEFT